MGKVTFMKCKVYSTTSYTSYNQLNSTTLSGHWTLNIVSLMKNNDEGEIDDNTQHGNLKLIIK